MGNRVTRYRCLVADPPWKFGDSLPGKGRGAAKHYDCMPLAELCTFELPPMLPDSWLFLWRVGSMQQEALAVARAWGFSVTSEIVWVKPQMGMGRTVRNCHEVCLVCRRGKPERKSAAVRSWFEAPRGRHSAKPERFFELVEQLTEGPYVELFARRQRPGWVCLGAEVEQP